MMKNINRYIILTILTTSIVSCQKYLDIKPRSSIVIPETLDDLYMLLDNSTTFRLYPEFIELQADDYYLKENYWLSIPQTDKNVHVWEKDIFGTEESHTTWSGSYTSIFYANAVLDGLKSIEKTETNKAQHDQIKGSALFLKAEAVYLLTQLFCKVYDKTSADKELGIPVPMSADINEKVSRPFLAANFEFITNSLVEAEKLLSPTIDFSRPSKGAAHALLARVYLYMGEYKNSLIHAGKSIDFFADITDFNVASKKNYQNVLLLRTLWVGNHIVENYSFAPSLISKEVYNKYDTNDIRKTSFFDLNPEGFLYKKGAYTLTTPANSFVGLDSDEQFLIRAESYARIGNTASALQDLNHLLKHRYKTGSFTQLTSTNTTEVLNWVLEERRKELIFRGLRWSDLKRFNRDGANITLKRQLGNQTFTLPPNDNRWVLPIPTNEIKISGIQQNER